MANAVIVNFAAGETAPKSRGRFDLAWFHSSCEKLLNFIAEIPGPARFRTGFKTVRHTRGDAVARLIPFQFNKSRSYMLEFTAGKMRAYLGGDLVSIPRTTLTAATNANPCVLTVDSITGIAEGGEIILSGVLGMPELNGRQVKVGVVSTKSFPITDPGTGHDIDSTNWGTWTSGGSVAEVSEIASPYLADDLDDISLAASAVNGVAYIAHPKYAPRKLTVDAANVFTLSTYSRTNDPFAVGAARNIVGVSRGTQTWLYFAVGTAVTVDRVYAIAAVGGTTELNTNSYRVSEVGEGHSLGPGGGGTTYVVARIVNKDTGADINSTAYGAYTTGGTATPVAENPIAAAFYEGRLGFFGTDARPDTVFLSRAPDDNGVPRYDDFTGGTDADHACFFALAPVNRQVDYIAWAQGTVRHLVVGTFGGPFRLSGGGVDEPITPNSINARQFDPFGCESSAPVGSSRLFYIQRGGRSLRSVYIDMDTDELSTYDMLLNAEHIAHSRLLRAVFQAGRPDVIWVIREDGILAGMTIQGKENVAGWHRHKLAGVDAKILDAQPLSRTDRDDQLWIVSERTVDGHTRRCVEILADDVDFPDIEDFYSGPENRAADLALWKSAVYRRQEEYIHLDAAATYNGSDRGVAAGATLTPGAKTGTSITFTAGASVFRSTDVGNELWKKPNRDTGEGAGRAVITGYTSPTQVTCDIETDFDATTAIAAGDWHIAADDIYVPHLEGARVAVVTDGAVYSDGQTADYDTVTVTEGKITLAEPAAVVHVGLPYEGFLKTHNLELGGQAGPVQNKPRNIVKMFIRFLATLGVDYGTDIYDLERIEHRDVGNDALDRPAPVFSGAKEVYNPDNYEAAAGKHVVISQRLPLPCVVQSIDIHFDVTEEA